MTTRGTQPQDDDRDVRPLGSATSEPTDDDADATAGPVYPPPETEPDADR